MIITIIGVVISGIASVINFRNVTNPSIFGWKKTVSYVLMMIASACFGYFTVSLGVMLFNIIF